MMRLSARKIANMGTAYTDTIVGMRVRHTLTDGTIVTGTVESFRAGYPVLRLTDGRTVRTDLTLDVI